MMLTTSEYESAFTVFHSTTSVSKLEPPQLDESYEIFLSNTDGLVMFVNDVAYSVNKNDLLVFGVSDFHYPILSENVVYDRIVARFAPEYIYGLSTDTTNLVSCFSQGSPVRRLNQAQLYSVRVILDKLLKIKTAPRYGDVVLKRVLLCELLVAINRIWRESANVEAQSTSANSRIDSIIKYINLNLANDLTLHRISEEFFLSKYYLCRIFKSATGHTLSDFITFRRIIAASELLKSGVNVDLVCDKVGFNSNSHFITTFKRLIGTTPKKFALKHTENQSSDEYE